MDLSAHDSYLETQVHTATPQRLRLMLIDGALRQARAAQQAWTEQRLNDAAESLIRCRDIVAELLSGIRIDKSPVVQQTLGIYAFVFSALTEVQQSRDTHQLAGIIRVLEEDRETWQQVCFELPHRVAPIDPSATQEELAPQRVASTFQPNYGGSFAAPSAPLESLSIEA